MGRINFARGQSSTPSSSLCFLSVPFAFRPYTPTTSSFFSPHSRFFIPSSPLCPPVPAAMRPLRPDVQVSPWDGTGLLVYYVPPCIQTPWTPESSLCESRTARRSTRYIVVVRCWSLRACWSISVEHSAPFISRTAI